MNKLTLFLLCSIFFVSISSYAQKNESKTQKGLIGITFSSFGATAGLDFAKGAASFNGKSFFAIGVNYLYPLNKCLDIETGIEYSYYKISIQPNLPPDMDNTPYIDNFSLLNIPVTLRVNFLKYCFIEGGLLIDIDAEKSSPIDRQTGIGLNLGIGLKYDFDLGLSVFVNPYIKTHSLISFSSEQNHQRVLESGFRFGVMYKLK